MTLKVCLGACSLRKVRTGGYLWMFLNWALGLQELGCRVIWLTTAFPEMPHQNIRNELAYLRRELQPFGLADQLTIVSQTGEELPVCGDLALPAEAAANADFFINLAYIPSTVVKRFRRTAFVDIDPGLTQTWISRGELEIAVHDIYFTLGETVGRPGSPIPECGVHWVHIPPPVHLPSWPVTPAATDRPYTTVSGWWGEWIRIKDQDLENSKRVAFLDVLDLPSLTDVQLELALPAPDGPTDEDARRLLRQHGWSVRDAASSPEAHRCYVGQSRGEFACMKPAYSLLQTAWTSERSINYLAGGKPVILQHTGPSFFLPDAEGLLRFRNVDEAARCLAAVERDYTRHCRAARALAEEWFDARKVIGKVLERALG